MLQTESVWLGQWRKPLRLATWAACTAALGLAVWLIVGGLFFGSDIGMHEMLRPEGRPMVQAMLWSLFVALTLASVYLSDTKGSIEPERTGPIDLVSLILSRLAMIGIVFTVLVMAYEVGARYIFEAPTLWANELSLWIASFVFLLAGLYAMQQRSHIRIYIIYDMMPRPMRKASDVLSLLLIWIFVGCLIWGGFNESWDKFQRMETFGTAWNSPLPATVKPAILILGLAVAIQALSNLIADWNKTPEQHSPADEIDESEIETLRRIAEGKN